MENLLREMSTKMSEISLSERTISVMEEEMETYRLAKKEFLELLPSGLSGKNLVIKSYELYDRLVGGFLSNHPIACGPKCELCCHQLVCCSNLEMGVIKNYLLSLNRQPFRKIKRRAVKQVRKFHEYCKKITGNKIHLMSHTNFFNGQTLIDWHGRLCPYLLENKNCGIYPVRPADCRIAKVQVRCGTVSKKEDLKPIRLFIDQIMCDVISKEEGSSQVTPLVYWPIVREFSELFFKN